MRAWFDRGAVIATMLVLVSGSFYGVVRFSVATGGLNWFQQAWDEPFYFADILDSSFRLDSRSASHLLGQLLLAFGVRDPAWIILAYDLVSYFWAQREAVNRIEVGTDEFAALIAVDGAAAALRAAPTPDTLSAYRVTQARLRRPGKANRWFLRWPAWHTSTMLTA